MRKERVAERGNMLAACCSCGHRPGVSLGGDGVQLLVTKPMWSQTQAISGQKARLAHTSGAGPNGGSSPKDADRPICGLSAFFLVAIWARTVQKNGFAHAGMRKCHLCRTNVDLPTDSHPYDNW